MSHRPYRRRHDRLHKLAELLRTPEPQRPGALAEQLGVSVPTLCRDVAELQIQGLAVEGNAGSGWRFLRQAAVGPLSFSHDEVEALLTMWRLAQPQLAPAQARSAGAALERLLALLPPDKREEIERRAAYAPVAETGMPQRLETLRLASEAHRKLRLVLDEGEGRRTELRVRPLACRQEGGSWTLHAWIEGPERFGSFPLERLQRIEVLEQTFEPEAGRGLDDMEDSGGEGRPEP